MRRFLLEPYQCQGHKRFCELFDRALINLAAQELGRPLSWQTYEQMSQSILNGHASLVTGIGAGEFTYPGSADQFTTLIETFHHRLFGGTRLSFAGRLRNRDVQYGAGHYTFDGVPPEKVRFELMVLFETVLRGETSKDSPKPNLRR